MAQSTGGISFVDAEISIGANGSDWTDISGFANTLTVSGGERNFGEFFTADGDIPVLRAGKRGSLNVAVVLLYTEGTAEATEVPRGYYETAGGGATYVKWLAQNGGFTYTTTAGILVTPTYPGGDPEPGDPIEIEFSVQVPSIAKS